jgi:hypothetical protein
MAEGISSTSPLNLPLPSCEEIYLKIQILQLAKNYKALAQFAGIRVFQGHCGWGWRNEENNESDDFYRESDAWEAACFESGLMLDMDELQDSIADSVRRNLGL